MRDTNLDDKQIESIVSGVSKRVEQGVAQLEARVAAAAEKAADYSTLPTPIKDN